MPDIADDRPRRRGAVIGGIAAVAAAVGLGLVVMVGLAGDNPLDLGWAGLMAALRDSAPWLLGAARALDQLGGGTGGIVVVPLVVLAALGLARRPWGALYFALATVLGAAAVQLLKLLFARERPQDMLVTSDAGSFPSGHVANATIMALVLAILLGRWWVWVLGSLWVLAMLAGRTYLSVHWLTDTLGGLALSAGVVLLLGAAMWAPLSREWTRGQRAAADLTAA